ncbi:MAG: hypothetical protein AB7O57_11655 [Hyphomicrobiaceae bacterium]
MASAMARTCTILAAVATLTSPSHILSTAAHAQSLGNGDGQILSRNVGVTRARAAQSPRSEGDQAVVDGWPLYRTERGQAAYNAAMATMRATDGRAPSAAAFKGCAGLACTLKLPVIGADGWLPSGRIWLSPTSYVIVAHSPRMRGTSEHRRRPARAMRYFVFHEFHNSSRNTDVYDTISSHSGRVFVPLYMSRSATDAHGRQFVVVLQVAPYDVVSVHATNYGSAGPGMEVANNSGDPLEPLQATAGVLVGTMIKAAAPHLRVVNHRGNEGLPMLRAYESRLAGLSGARQAAQVALPFVPAEPAKVAGASGRLADLVSGRGASPRIPIAERRFVPPRETVRMTVDEPVPVLVAPARLASRLGRTEQPRLVEPIRLVRGQGPALAQDR